ncbi:histone-lysine N-methyltransferase SETMAR [Trichonephila clavipes]|nr:histone-lysine N-methyltransferase SETMAR [Trichonephila clavipes]
MKPIEIYRQICEFTDKPSYEDLAGTCLVILRTAPDLTPSDFHLFLHLKSFLAGKHFNNDKELKENVSNWLKTQAATFYEEGIEKLVPRYDTCLQNFGSYVERFFVDKLDNVSEEHVVYLLHLLHNFLWPVDEKSSEQSVKLGQDSIPNKIMECFEVLLTDVRLLTMIPNLKTAAREKINLFLSSIQHEEANRCLLFHMFDVIIEVLCSEKI